MTILQRALVLLVAVPGFCYLGDYAVFRFRGSPVTTVEIRQFYAIPIKGNKINYMPAESTTEQCAFSLFPHVDTRPCWYVNRHKLRQIDM